MGCLFNRGKWSLWWAVLSILSFFVHFFLFAFKLHLNQWLKFLKTISEKLKMPNLLFSFDNLLLKLFFIFDDLFSFNFVYLIFLLISFQFGDLVFDAFITGHSDLMLWTHLNKFLDSYFFVLFICLDALTSRRGKFL